MQHIHLNGIIWQCKYYDVPLGRYLPTKRNRYRRVDVQRSSGHNAYIAEHCVADSEIEVLHTCIDCQRTKHLVVKSGRTEITVFIKCCASCTYTDEYTVRYRNHRHGWSYEEVENYVLRLFRHGVIIARFEFTNPPKFRDMMPHYTPHLFCSYGNV